MSATPTSSTFIRYRNEAVTSTKILVRAGNTNIFGWVVNNPNNTEIFVQLHDAAATTDVTLGTTVSDIPIRVPAQGSVVISFPPGSECSFTLGLVIAATTAEKSSTAPLSAVSVALLIR